MKKLAVLAAVLAAVGVSSVPSASFAANAKHPYKNVNKANDKGNNTGDAAVARLNQQQLDKIKSGQ